MRQETGTTANSTSIECTILHSKAINAYEYLTSKSGGYLAVFL